MSYLLLVISLVLILPGALVFTNSVEWAGRRLGLGAGAVGSILAAVATALPESVIPVIAIIRGGKEAEEVAIGAVVGAPFLLGTLAMALVGLGVRLFGERRPQGTDVQLHAATTKRDLTVFLAVFAVAMGVGIWSSKPARVVAAAALVIAYAVYAWASATGGGEVQDEEELDALYADPTKHDPPRGWPSGRSWFSASPRSSGAHISSSSR